MITDRFIREPECLKITGLSRPTRWRLEKEGKFPKRRKISENTMGWLASEIDEWIKNRIEYSNQELSTDRPAFRGRPKKKV